MKTKQGFRLRQVCGENVIVGEGIENIDFSKIINMNESAAYLWEKVAGKEFTAAEMRAKHPDRMINCRGLESEQLST